MKWLVVALCLTQAAQYTIANGVPVFVWGDTAYVTALFHAASPTRAPQLLTRDRFHCRYKAAPVLSSQATHNLETVLADDTTAKVIFVESQVSRFNDFTTD